ncbi:hypothetical protein L596_025971 [Steinernema carpocapsae]|uniref:Uncharacterized protein n=1 Tax=Steinernema carpocapsae TaxID=34508 RepID=A0A4U5M9G3_STECR|nr:hypothetical protein L596_025971 [Steinernema carpocapsae]
MPTIGCALVQIFSGGNLSRTQKLTRLKLRHSLDFRRNAQRSLNLVQKQTKKDHLRAFSKICSRNASTKWFKKREHTLILANSQKAEKRCRDLVRH